uniref:Uncharacterized protein n=1 Tax=Rhizophora mucronata TaxID=61149 RepID=A0A2P2QCL5_RHIMU
MNNIKTATRSTKRQANADDLLKQLRRTNTFLIFDHILLLPTLGFAC